jgi:hypothetical protein
VKVYSARQAGRKLGLSHLEVIRRLNRGDIDGQKLDWNWIITEEAIQKAKNADWYLRRQARVSGSDASPATS